jgi:hypothetical protein
MSVKSGQAQSVELLDLFCDRLGPSDAVLLERLLGRDFDRSQP